MYGGHSSVIIVMYLIVSGEQGKKQKTFSEKRIAWGISENNADDPVSQMGDEGGFDEGLPEEWPQSQNDVGGYMWI